MGSAVKSIRLCFNEQNEWIESVLNDPTLLDSGEFDREVAGHDAVAQEEEAKSKDNTPSITFDKIPAQRPKVSMASDGLETINSSDVQSVRSTGATGGVTEVTSVTEARPDVKEKHEISPGITSTSDVSTHSNDADESSGDESSFEAISNNIRKSMKNDHDKKQSLHSSKSSASKTNTLSSTKESISAEQREAKEQIKEISHLIEEDSDDLLMSDLDGDFALGKLEKIELSDIRIPLKDSHDDETSKLMHSKTGVTPLAQSPIKFAELPSREPLRVRSTHKRSTRSVKRSHRRSTKSLAPKSPTTEAEKRHAQKNKPKPKSVSPSPFLELARERSPAKKQFKLKLPPPMYTGSINADDEDPTIKLDRGRKTMLSRKLHRSLSEKEGYDLKLPRIAPEIPTKSKKSPVKRNLQYMKSHGDESRKRIPLTEQSLRPPESSKLYASAVREVSGSSSSHMAVASQMIVHRHMEKRRLQDHQMHVKRVKTMKERGILQPVNSNRVRKAAAPTKSFTKIKKEPLETIPTSISASDAENSVVNQRASDYVAQWAGDEALEVHLRKQAKIDPMYIFGEVPKVDCDEIFGRHYSASLNAKWRAGDRLTSNEIENYNRKMGWI